MKKLLFSLLGLLLVLSLLGCSREEDEFNGIKGQVKLISAQQQINDTTNQLVDENNIHKATLIQANPSELLLSCRSDNNIKQVLEDYKLTQKGSLKDLGILLVETTNDINLANLLTDLNQDRRIEFAELNNRMQLLSATNTFEQLKENWNYKAISLSQTKLDNNSNLTVAVIDTGVDLDHPDLKEQLVTGVDVTKSDFSTGNINYNPDDTYGHGTHVSGIIATVAPNTNIMPIRVLSAAGGSNYDVAKGIEWAVNHGAEVVNLSLGSSLPSLTLKQAINYAYQEGVIVVAATGNGGQDKLGDPHLLYPARYEKTIAVGAINSNLDKSNFSNYGRRIDFVAPGGDGEANREYIYSTVIDGYGGMAGTSMAAPHVAGVAALVLASGQATTPTEVKEQLQLTAQDLGNPGWDLKYGSGLINAYAAVADAKINQAQVFAGEKIDSIIEKKSKVVNPASSGVYKLSEAKEGRRHLYAWLDVNNNDRVDEGDYFGKTDSPVGSGLNTNLNLKLITDTDLSVTVK
ncbi:hypothetical protein JCM16358_13390 [Halanaerocella petrolearia]